MDSPRALRSSPRFMSMTKDARRQRSPPPEASFSFTVFLLPKWLYIRKYKAFSLYFRGEFIRGYTVSPLRGRRTTRLIRI